MTAALLRGDRNRLTDSQVRKRGYDISQTVFERFAN